MKRIFAALLLFLISANSVSAGEPAKFYNLYKHYHSHKTADNTLTFSEYLYMHYVSDDGNPDDNSEDESLPFKSDEFNQQMIQIPASGSCECAVFIMNKVLWNSSRNFFSSGEEKGIWQPPK